MNFLQKKCHPELVEGSSAGVRRIKATITGGPEEIAVAKEE